MMDLNSIVALAQAGFTKEQIYQLSQVQQPAQPMQQPMQQPVMQPMVQQPVMYPVQQPMQQPVMQPAQQPIQQPAQQPIQQPITQAGAETQKDPFMMLFEQMTGIKKAIQDNNISNSQIAGSEPQSTDDILASIIQPTKPKEDK